MQSPASAQYGFLSFPFDNHADSDSSEETGTRWNRTAPRFTLFLKRSQSLSRLSDLHALQQPLPFGQVDGAGNENRSESEAEAEAEAEAESESESESYFAELENYIDPKLPRSCSFSLAEEAVLGWTPFSSYQLSDEELERYKIKHEATGPKQQATLIDHNPPVPSPRFTFPEETPTSSPVLPDSATTPKKSHTFKSPRYSLDKFGHRPFHRTSAIHTPTPPNTASAAAQGAPTYLSPQFSAITSPAFLPIPSSDVSVRSLHSGQSDSSPTTSDSSPPKRVHYDPEREALIKDWFQTVLPAKRDNLAVEQINHRIELLSESIEDYFDSIDNDEQFKALIRLGIVTESAALAGTETAPVTPVLASNFPISNAAPPAPAATPAKAREDQYRRVSQPVRQSQLTEISRKIGDRFGQADQYSIEAEELDPTGDIVDVIQKAKDGVSRLTYQQDSVFSTTTDQYMRLNLLDSVVTRLNNEVDAYDTAGNAEGLSSTSSLIRQAVHLLSPETVSHFLMNPKEWWPALMTLSENAKWTKWWGWRSMWKKEAGESQNTQLAQESPNATVSREGVRS